jgi:disulfide oxidoreductase YuzD
MFGNQINVHYHDAASPEVNAQFSGVLKEASERDWPHPLVLVNDKIVMVGDVDAYHLSGLIQQALAN